MKPAKVKRRRGTKRRLLAGVGLSAALTVAVIVGWYAYQAAANLPGTPVPSLGNAHRRFRPLCLGDAPVH